ncbi:MAG: hypothetical protein RML12_04400 [Xanthomonadales bacterium]|nr:hypothetical protein [Xanthomonadales bacterium]
MPSFFSRHALDLAAGPEWRKALRPELAQLVRPLVAGVTIK